MSGPGWGRWRPEAVYAAKRPQADAAAAVRLAFWQGVVAAWVDGPIEAVELYHVPDPEPLRVGHPVAVAVVLTFLVLARLLRFARRRPQDVIVVVTPAHVVLLQARAGALHGWRVVSRVGAWPRAAVRAEVGHFYELDLTTPDGRRFSLTPASLTPGAIKMAASLSGTV